MTQQLLNPGRQFPAENSFRREENERGFIFKNWTPWHSGALIGLLGGLAVLIGTSFLEAAEYLTGEKSHGGALFFTVLALMFFGAHCLDKVRETNKAERIERYKKREMNHKN